MKTKVEIGSVDESDSPRDTLVPKTSSLLKRLQLVLLKFRWLFFCVATNSAVIWWYEFRPVQLASMKMQGNWQWSEGTLPNEQFLEKYLQIDRNESWFVYPFRDDWHVQRDRLTINQADNFFVVRRAFGFDYGTTRETEYVVCLKNDGLYILRGLARLDSVLTPSVEKLRGVASIPDDAKQSIQEYLRNLNK